MEGNGVDGKDIRTVPMALEGEVLRLQTANRSCQLLLHACQPSERCSHHYDYAA